MAMTLRALQADRRLNGEFGAHRRGPFHIAVGACRLTAAPRLFAIKTVI